LNWGGSKESSRGANSSIAAQIVTIEPTFGDMVVTANYYIPSLKSVPVVDAGPDITTSAGSTLDILVTSSMDWDKRPYRGFGCQKNNPYAVAQYVSFKELADGKVIYRFNFGSGGDYTCTLSAKEWGIGFTVEGSDNSIVHVK
ncbi:MAG: hypothetical protein WCI27_04200, partial [Candidatus Omnitrophota bacterium]